VSQLADRHRGARKALARRPVSARVPCPVVPGWLDRRMRILHESLGSLLKHERMGGSRPSFAIELSSTIAAISESLLSLHASMEVQPSAAIGNVARSRSVCSSERSWVHQLAPVFTPECLGGHF
jgi:hypothetical protein